MGLVVSSKYQVVIPKAVRKQLSIKPGQKVRVTATADGRAILEKEDSLDIVAVIQKYAGSIKNSDTEWGKAGMDATDWIRKMRDEEWDR